MNSMMRVASASDEAWWGRRANLSLSSRSPSSKARSKVCKTDSSRLQSHDGQRDERPTSNIDEGDRQTLIKLAPTAYDLIVVVTISLAAVTAHIASF